MNTTQGHVIETEQVVVYIQREIFQAFICFNFDKYGLQLIKPQIENLRNLEY